MTFHRNILKLLSIGLCLLAVPLHGYAQEMVLCGIRLNAPIDLVRATFGKPNEDLSLDALQNGLLYKMHEDGVAVFTYRKEPPHRITAIQITGADFRPQDQFPSLQIGDPLEKAFTLYGAPVVRDSIRETASEFFEFDASNISLEAKGGRITTLRILWNEYAQLKDQVAEFAKEVGQPLSQAQLAAAIRYMEARHYAQALILFKDLKRMHPDRPEFSAEVGKTYMLQQKYAEALEEFDRAIARHPDFPAMRVHRAMALYALNRFQEAVETLRTVAQKNIPGVVLGSASDAWMRLGNLYEQEEFPADALAHYDRALQAAPDNTEARLGKAIVLERSQRVEDALQLLAGLPDQPENSIQGQTVRRLRMKQLLLPSPALSDRSADFDGDGTPEQIELLGEQVIIRSRDGRSWTAGPVGRLGARGQRSAQIRQATAADLDRDGLPELVLAVDPAYRMTPTVVIYHNLGRLQFRRMIEGLIPGHCVDNTVEQRIDTHRFTQAIDFAVKEFPVDKFLRENLPKGTYGCIVAYPGFFHVDKRTGGEGFEWFVDQRHVDIPDSLDTRIVEPTVQAVAAGRCGRDGTPVIAALAEGKLWVWCIDGLLDNGLLQKRVLKPAVPDDRSKFTALSRTAAGHLLVRAGDREVLLTVEHGQLVPVN